jgi:hypothetical protein
MQPQSRRANMSKLKSVTEMSKEMRNAPSRNLNKAVELKLPKPH